VQCGGGDRANIQIDRVAGPFGVIYSDASPYTWGDPGVYNSFHHIVRHPVSDEVGQYKLFRHFSHFAHKACLAMKFS